MPLASIYSNVQPLNLNMKNFYAIIAALIFCSAAIGQTTNPCNPEFSFSVNAPGNNVSVTPVVGNATGIVHSWNWGDGTPWQTGISNPVHVYASNGVFNIRHAVTKYSNSNTPDCTDSTTRVVTIATQCNIQASYSTAPGNPGFYTFTNTSTGMMPGDSVKWTFGDGTTAIGSPVTHQYTSNGTFNVCVIVKRNTVAGTTPCIRESCAAVAVTLPAPNPCTLSASFTSAQVSAATTPYYYVFTNTSTGAASTDSIRWIFGDGTSANTYNATHAYAQPGTYNVCLRIIKRTATGALSNCISDVCHQITVQAPPVNCMQLSLFSFTPNTTGNIISVAATNVDPGTTYTWTFGDGTGAIGPNASHTYTSGGNKTVCLTAYKNANCASTTCNSVYIPPCAGISLYFTDSAVSSMPNRKKFTAYANSLIYSQQWTITKLPLTPGTAPVVLTTTNPTYTFTDTGTYRVCVRAVFANQCVKEVCRNIYIGYVAPAPLNCVLQPFPNPATSSVSANVTLGSATLINAYIFNSANVIVAQKQQAGVIGNNIVTVPIGNLPAGVYTIRIYYNNDVCTGSFVKQ